MNTETNIQREIMIALSEHNCFVLRQQAGVFYDSTGNRVRIGFPGLSDLLAVNPQGEVAFLEVKTSPRAHKRKEQIEFIDAMKRRGYRADFVWSVEQALGVALDER